MIKEIKKEEYVQYFNKYCTDKSKIDINQYSDTYYLMHSKDKEPIAACGIHNQKSRISQINGIFSIKRSGGKKMMQYLPDKLVDEFGSEFLRLNCIGKKLCEYYKNLGYNEYLEINKYKEMIKDIK